MSSCFEKFEELQKEGKRLAAEGRLHESLHKFELARKIKETSKILSRIQKLKDVIGQNEKKDNPARKSEKSFVQKSSGSVDKSEKLSGILNQIQNIEVQKENPLELSPESLKRFNELKSKGIELSYEGKFDESLHCFSEARKLCDCPKVKKYIQELETLVSKYPKKLEEFQNLTNTGKKLASAGKQAESLEKLRNAFAVCPSPAVSRMIKKIQDKSSPIEVPVFSPPEFSEHLSRKNTDKDAEVSTHRIVSISSESKENHLNFSIGKNGSTGSEFSLPSGSGSTSVNPADLSPDAKERFRHLYTQAREQAAAGQLQEALDNLEEARKICPTEKILKRIKDLKEHMKQLSLESSSDMIEVSDGFFIFHEIYNKLYPYQREGISWMWKLFKMKKGGVLGDDMGLGKTFQVIAFLSGLIDADLVKCALIIMPVSLLPNWEREFRKWCPGISVSLFHGTSKRERERNLLRVQRRGHVLLTSYGMVLNAIDLLTDFEGRSFVWDYVILDEGHKIKNPTKTTKAVHAIASKNRLVLTGTPIQNNLLELWALYDFVHQGTLLGSLKTFKMQYENTITRAREKGSTAGEKHLGTEMAENLKMLIKPYFLRRTKAEIWSKEPETSEGLSDLDKELEKLRISENKVNTRKNDLIVWTFMSEAQCEIYRSFLHSEAVKTILVSKRSPLVELTTLKKICDHPRLLSQRACLQLGLNGDLNEEDLQRELNDESSYSSSIENVTDETLMAESGKMKFLIQLLENLKNEGHRTLVFSLSRKILDMINRILINRRWKVLRIDGTISKIEERERRIQLFQNDASYSVFLLTTQVGGVGITLTAADRVVIYDPSWNPATDAQAVDRIYRIGQTRNVIVYRLITCGTVEEKIYRRQIFKDSITKQATTSADPYRYFSKQELRELFTFENPHHSATQVQLSQLHSHQRLSDTELDAHIAYLYSLDIFGISDHDLMFSREIQDNTEDNENAAVSHDYIKKQVAAAQMLIQTEASVVAEGIRLAGTFSRPFAEHVPLSKSSKAVAQIPKAISSPNSDSKPKAPLRISPNYLLISHQSRSGSSPKDSSHIISDASTPLFGKKSVDISKYASPTGSGREKNMSYKYSTHDTELDNNSLHTNNHVSIIELNSDGEEINDQNPQVSRNRMLIPHKSDDEFAPKDSSNVIFEPLLRKRIVDLSEYGPPTGSVRDKNISLKDSIHETEMDNYSLDLKNIPVTELNSDNEERKHHISPNDIMTLHQSGDDLALNESKNLSNIYDPSTPLENKSADGCSNISKYASPVGSGGETNISVQYSESVHEDLDAKHVSVAELSGDAKMNNYSSSVEKNLSIRNMEQIKSVESNSYIQSEDHSICENNGTDQDAALVLPKCSILSEHHSICENDETDLDAVQASPNSSFQSEHHSICENDGTDLDAAQPNSSIQSEHHSICENDGTDLDAVQASPNSSFQSEHHSICENDGTDLDAAQPNSSIQSEHHSISENDGTDLDVAPASTSTETGAHNNLPKFGESPLPSTDSHSSRRSETSFSNDSTSSHDQSSDQDSKCQENLNGSYIHSQTSEVISAETTPEKKCSFVDFEAMDVSLEDLNFDEKPRIAKRKSCALPVLFVASDSDSSCPPSPSKGDCADFLATSDSEDSPEEKDESVCFVPSSIPNSPAPRDTTFYNRTERSRSPATRRITPLKVRKSFCPPPDRAFAQALASSPIIQPPRYMSDSDEDTPVKVCRTAGRKKVIESSDED